MRRRIYADGLRTLARYRLRTFLMMLGVVIGVTALTLILTIAEGTEQKVLDEIERMFTANNILVRAGGEEMRAGPLSGGPTTTLTPADLEAIAGEIATIDRWDALQMIGSRQVTYRSAATETRIFGQTPQSETLGGRTVLDGDYFDEGHMERAARVALIGTDLVAELFGDQDPIGQQIEIGGVPFRVLGVLEPMGTDLHGMNRDDEILVPLSAMMRRLMNVDHVLFGKLHVADPDTLEATAERVATMLRERHSVGPNDPDDFTLITPLEVRRMVARSNRVFSLVLPLVAGVALLIASFVVANLMLGSVNERARELGLRRAVGARAGDIVAQLVAETLVVTSAGGLVGIGLGLWGARVVEGLLELPPVVSWPALVIGVTASVVVGVLAAVAPARRAVAVDPVVVLR